MKKTLVFLLLIGLLCSLCACGSSPYIGHYKGIYVETEGGISLMEDYYNGENYLELKKGGKATMMVNKTAHELKWEEDQGELTFYEAGDPFYGYISEGVIVLDYMGWGIKMTFALEGAQVPETTVQDPESYAQAMEAVAEYWNGDWYGWWLISEGSGEYADLPGVMSDLYATIQLDNGRGPIEIREIGGQEQPLGQCILRIDPTYGANGVGIAMSGQGSFKGQAVNAGDWLIDPSLSAYENLLEISGYYSDEKGDFFYTLYLRPWGQLWEDIREGTGADVMPNGLPVTYEAYKEAISVQVDAQTFFKSFEAKEGK